jgi:hypothetical protein
MLEIVQELKQWRKNRNLKVELDKKVLIGNMLEECSEYFRADTNYDKIDALCDISVFAINSIDGKQGKDLIELDITPPFTPLVDSSIYKIINALSNMEYNSMQHFLVDMVNISYEMIYLLGYDYKKCMLETIKEISSREQCPIQVIEWQENGISGKWLKNRNQDPKTLYKANYESCKIK